MPKVSATERQICLSVLTMPLGDQSYGREEKGKGGKGPGKGSSFSLGCAKGAAGRGGAKARARAKHLAKAA